MIDAELIRKISALARLDLDDSELSQFTSQLGRILDYFKMLNELDTSGTEPSVYPVDIGGPLRQDEERESTSREAILANTTHKKEGFYVVPKVLE